MGLKQTKKGQDITAITRQERQPLKERGHNAVGAANGIGQKDDYLYVIADGNFYRLTPAQIKTEGNLIHVKSATKRDRPIIDALQALQNMNAVVADLQAPGAVAASCACIALNIDVFDGHLQRLAKSQKV
jgi:hypothetical protein